MFARQRKFFVLRKYIGYIFTFLLLINAGLAFSQANCNFVFYNNKTVGCYPYPILALADTSAPKPVSWTWILTDCGGTPIVTFPNSGPSFSQAPPGPGCYTLTMKPTYANGSTCTFSRTNIIESDTPRINATIGPSPLCIGGTVCATLTNTPQCNIMDSTYIVWGGGASDAVPGNPNSLCHVYDAANYQPGCYSVTIFAKNSCGCSSAKTYDSAVCLVPKPHAHFIADVVHSVCQPSLTSNFTADDAGPNVIYCWYVNKVQKQCSISRNFTYTFPVSQNGYEIKLVATQPAGCVASDSIPNFITVLPSPDTTIVLNADSSCLAAGSSFQLCLSSPFNINPQWTITGQGTNVQGAGNPFCTNLSNLGYYDITLTVTSGPNCSISVTKKKAFYIKPRPTACFTVDDSFGCNPNNFCVNFTNCTNPIGGNTYSWSFGPAPPNTTPSTFTGANPPQVCYNGFGKRDVTLVATSGNGCVGTTTKVGYINIDTLKPQFGISHPRGCGPLTTRFVSAPIPASFPEKIAMYTWDFIGAGAPPGQSGPLLSTTAPAIFTTPGCYSVRLTITTVSGCSSSIFVKEAVCVGYKPTPCTVTPDPLIKCYDSLPVTFNIACDSFNQLIINFGDGPPVSFGDANNRLMKAGDSIKHVYQDCGDFDVWMVAYRDSCPSDTLRRHITIKCPKADFKDSTSCAGGDTVFLIDKSHKATRVHWSFSCLPDTFNTRIVKVKMPTCTICTVYELAYNDSTGCMDHKTATINTSCNSPPSFTPGPDVAGCSCFNPVTKNTTLGADNGTTWWDLELGDGIGPASVSGPPCLHCYSGKTLTTNPPFCFNTGKSAFAMIYYAPSGCIDTLRGTIHSCAITPDFTPTAICLPDPVHFRATVLAQTDTFCDTKYKYSWNFDYGDSLSSSPSTKSDTVKYFPKEFVHYVRLTVTNSLGCVGTVTKNVYIGTTVNMAWSFDSTLCPGIPLKITNNTTSPAILVEGWKFAGGTPDTFTGHLPPDIIYSAEGDYPVIYHVIAGTCDKYDTMYVHIHSPELLASIDNRVRQCPPLIFTANNKSKYIDVKTDLITWSFYDSTRHQVIDTSHTYSPTESFSLPGVYFIRLCVTTNNGCTVCTDIDSVKIGGPYGFITPEKPTVCACQDSINFSIATVNADTSIFIFGCNQGFIPLRGFRTNGLPIGDANNPTTLNYRVSYCVRDTCSPQIFLTDTLNCNVRIIAPPIFIDSPTVYFKYSNYKVCDSGTVMFFDSTVYKLTKDTSYTAYWRWDFGDTLVAWDTSNLQNPSYFYSHPGNYHVSLLVKSNYGCLDSFSQTVVVYPAPVAYFALADSEICSNQAVCITDSSYSTSVPILTWQWGFGDGNGFSPGNNPGCYNYKAPFKQVYPITLALVDANGCVDSETIILRVHEAPHANYDWQITCEDKAMPFTNTSLTPGGALSTCEYTFWVGAPNPVISNNCDVNFRFPAGFYPVQLIVSDVNGCRDTIVQTVESDPFTTLDITPGDTIVCLGQSVDYALNGTYDSVSWVPNVWLTYNDAQHVTITPLGDITYVASAKSGVCPIASRTFTVLVVQSVPVGATATPDRIVKGQYSHLSADSLPQGNHVIRIDSVIWSPASSVQCYYCEKTTANPQQTTTYNVTAYYSRNFNGNSYPCSSSDDVTVTVLTTCDSGVVFVPNMFTPNGDGKNDVFMIRGMGATKINFFRVFDRWGTLLYEATNGVLNEETWGWDGTNLQGGKLNEGVYVYVYEVVCINQDVISGKGNVTLVR